MKPLTSPTEDTAALQNLGRASVQIVHDLKNQLNGLKLYATFLRKRMEKSDRPDDERETIGKLIKGLDRAASDLSTLVDYGQTIELKKHSGVDLGRILRGISLELEDSQCRISFKSESEPLIGEFDPALLTYALKAISVVAKKMRADSTDLAAITISANHSSADSRVILIKWSGLKPFDHDPFRSFVGGDEIQMSRAARVVENHGGSAEHTDKELIVMLPLSE